MLVVKILIILAMIGIFSALISGGMFLVQDQGKTTRTLTSLKWRIGLSVLLFCFLFLSFACGWIQPHGIR